MTFLDTVLQRTPARLRERLIQHRELLKFVVVGGICFVLTAALWWLGKLTVLGDKPVTAQAVAIIIATIVSYTLSREWSFRTRGGRERTHEAALFFLISGIGVVINLLPTLFSRYVLHLETPYVSAVSQEIADFVFGQILGTALAMLFRFWGFKKFVFPQEGARIRAVSTPQTAPPVVAKDGQEKTSDVVA